MRCNTSVFHVWLILLTSLLLASCDIVQQNADNARTITLQIRQAPGNGGSSADISQADSHADSLVMENVKFVVKELELERAEEGEEGDTEGDGNEDDREEDKEEFEREEFVVDLPLDGSGLSIAVEEVPTGLYEEFEFKVEDADDDSGISDTDLVEGDEDSLRYSTVIRGTYRGESFTYKSHTEFEQELEFDPPMAVSDTANTATIALLVDTSRWFSDGEGGVLDPNDPSNRERIDENIEESFEIEEDDDDDDDDDDEDEDDDN